MTIVVERDPESMTNEVTDARELVTNESTTAADVGLESPIYMNFRQSKIRRLNPPRTAKS